VSSVLIEVPIDPKACRHDSIEGLGHDRGAAFYRCSDCGSIMIVQQGHRWIIRPTDERGPLPF